MRARVESFCERFGLKLPILLAPMAGACPPSLSIEVMKAGGLGACGALPMQPPQIEAWAGKVRREAGGNFQINLWIPDPPPRRDPDHEARVREFLAAWGPTPPPDAGEATPPDFDAQCRTLLELRPPVVSSIMGLYPAEIAAEFERAGIAWFATASTVHEAVTAEAAGAKAIIAQGMEAGGHRGAFDAAAAERALVGLMSLVPAVVDAVQVPVVAAGGIADGRGVAAALALGAGAVVIGTGFLRCPEARIPAA
ncbi:MAG TPA: nitronate monooxygenase, partial [Pseudomonadales bacterium]